MLTPLVDTLKGRFPVKHLALALMAGASALALMSTPSQATLQYAIAVNGGASFVCVDNSGCDTNAATGIIQSASTTLSGITVTFSDQRQIIGPPQNALTTTSATITNTTGTTANVQFAVSGISYASPTGTFSASGSGTWLNAGGSNIQMQFYGDTANGQGAESATDLPGALLANSPIFTSDGSGTDQYSFGQNGAFVTGAPFSFTMYGNLNLTAGGSDILIGRSQDITANVAVPEPSSLLILGGSLIGMGWLVNRRRRKDDYGTAA